MVHRLSSRRIATQFGKASVMRAYFSTVSW